MTIVLGWDADGVIVDTEEHKRQFFMKAFGIQIEGMETKEKVIRALGISSKDSAFMKKYEDAKVWFYNTPEVTRKLRPVPGALEHLAHFAQKGITQIIITARQGQAYANIEEWLMRHKIEIPRVSSGRGIPKTALCRQHNVSAYTDDLTYQLVPLEHVECIRKLYLFSVDAEIPQGSRMVRVTSWPELYDRICTDLNL